MEKLKKSDVELIITVLGGVLLGLVVFITTTSISEMLILQKSSVLGIQFLEGVYLTQYFFLKELSKENSEFTKDNPFIYEINTNMPITSLEIGNNGFKINNFCFLMEEESNNAWKYALGFAAIKETFLIIGAARTKVKEVYKKIINTGKLAKYYNYLSLSFYFYSKYESITNKKICILEGKQLTINVENKKIIIKKEKNSKIGKNLVFKAYLENQDMIIEVGVN